MAGSFHFLFLEESEEDHVIHDGQGGSCHSHARVHAMHKRSTTTGGSTTTLTLNVTGIPRIRSDKG
jgi:hypothetical protein